MIRSGIVVSFMIVAGIGDDPVPDETPRQLVFARLGEWRVAYESRGQGERAIVFVHGWGSDHSTWRAQMDRLATNRRLIAVDLIGHGQSDKPRVDYTAGLLSRSVAAVMDHAHVKHAVLVGHSAGVPVIRELALVFPNRVEGLVVADGPLRQVVPEQMQQAMMARFRGPDYKETIRQTNNFLKPSGELTQADIDRAMNVTLATPQHVLISTVEAQLADDYWKSDRIELPVLAVYAKNPMWPMWTDEYEQFMRRLAPRVEYHLWHDTSHMLHLERATDFNALIENFVRRIDGGADSLEE